MKRQTLVTLFLATLVAAALVPLTAAGQDGRDAGAQPGTPAEEAVGAAANDPDTEWDGDGPAPRTLVHSGDSTIQGGLCVGFDCASNEPMGFATIKIEENNLRIAAADSSSVSGFPTRDWQIEFNSSSNGGGSYFMIRDCGNGGAAGSVDSNCGGTPMLTIEGGADNESIHVDSSGNQGGNVGFGTATPVVDLHTLSGNTPTLRLEQDGSSGFTAQSWDVASNESNFFIRDVTNGSTLPLRIEPGTASNTLYIDNDERIGMGTTAPEEELHIRTLETPEIQLEDSSSGVEWVIGDAGNGTFKISDIGASGTQFRLSGEGLFRIVAVASPPTTSIGLGAMYNDTSGALCWYDGANWLVVVGTGTCT